MTRAAASVWLRRPQDAAFTDFSDWVDRAAGAGYAPPSSDLHGIITTTAIRFVDPARTIPYEPHEGFEFELRDSTTALVFGGYIASPVVGVPGPNVPSWDVTATSWATRFAETATGSLDKSAILDSDRNFVIAIIRDGMSAVPMAYGSDTVGADDPLVAANEAVGWIGVRHTAFVYGGEWSYGQTLVRLRNLMDRVPGTSLRVRPDRIVEYGVFAEPAPVVLASVTDANVMGALGALEPRAYDVEVLADAPAAYWRLGETSGTVARDSSGNARNATLVAADLTMAAAGAVGDGDTAFQTKGAAGWKGSSTALGGLLGGSKSVESWIRFPGGASENWSNLANRAWVGDGWLLFIDVSKIPYFGVGKAGIQYQAVGPAISDLTAWHHLVGTYDGANPRLYVDGVLVATGGVIAGAATDTASAVDFLQMGTTSALAYVQDELALYPTALSAARIAAHYAAGRRARVIEIDADSYAEEIMNAGHFNKVRLGGFGAAEHTAYDTTSIGLLGRVLATPYENDETIPAADIIRAAYAKLAKYPRRRVVRCTTTNDVSALEPGMLVPVLVSDKGCWLDEGWSAPMEHEGYLGTPLLEPCSGFRGELLVQKVTPTFVAPGVQAYELELGDHIQDFDRAVAERIGG